MLPQRGFNVKPATRLKQEILVKCVTDGHKTQVIIKGIFTPRLCIHKYTNILIPISGFFIRVYKYDRLINW